MTGTPAHGYWTQQPVGLHQTIPHFVFHRHLRLPPTPVSVGLLHQTTSCAAWLSAADRDWDEKGSREPEIGGGKPVSHNKLRCNFARVCSFSLGPSAATEVFASEHSETWKPMSMQGAGGKGAPPVNTEKKWNENSGARGHAPGHVQSLCT